MKKYILLAAVISMMSCDHLKKHFEQMTEKKKTDSIAVDTTRSIKKNVDPKLTADTVHGKPVPVNN